MPEFSETIIHLFKRVAEEGGLLSGQDPTAVNTDDPIRLWIVQVGIIVCMASVLSLALKKFRQPKVIAEVLGGIILGPTAFGRIPGFTHHIFPPESRPFLNLVATIGLCLFLFLVGLEIDISVIRRNAKLSAAVALAGMCLPFGFGAVLSIPIYHRFIDSSVQFTHFMLFTGVAYSITAFPVLCRILTELKLLDTTVGIIALSAGVGNDIVGWTLLALSIALVNAGSGLTALYILLTCVAFAIFLLVPGKIAFQWLAKVTGSIEHGPSVVFMTMTMMVMLGSSFFTDIIGVHPIFGAFLTGLIVPREGGLTIALTEKLEDMVAIIFLPLYFTISGLNTDLGQLNNGITWAFTIAIMVLAFVGKFGGCTLAAHYVARFNWRESATIGSLMSCKGLVELIVLNVGLEANILSTRVFSMFVLEALVLTCMTTPLVTTLYPLQYRTRISKTGANFNNVPGDPEKAGQKSKKGRGKKDKQRSSQERPSESERYRMEERTRFSVVLDRIEHLPGAMAVAQLLNPLVHGFDDDRDLDSDVDAKDMKDAKDKASTLKLELPSMHLQSPTASAESLGNASISTSSSSWPTPIINALRLIKLTDRVSVVMKSHDIPTLLHTDPLLNIFRMFALLQGINVYGDMDVVPEEDLVNSTLEKADSFDAEMIVIPWALNVTNTALPGDAWLGPAQRELPTPKTGIIHNPFDTLFSTLTKEGNTSPISVSSPTPLPARPRGQWSFTSNSSISHSHFIRSVFARSDVDVGLYIDQSGPIATSMNEGDIGRMNVALASGRGKGRGRIHVLLPFFGGPDDRLALEFVVGVCRRNERLRATILRLRKVESTEIGATMTDQTCPGGDNLQGDKHEEANMATVISNINGFPDTVYGQPNTEVRLQSEAADDIVWAKYATPTSIPSTSNAPSSDPTVLPPTRVTFKDIASDKPLHIALQEAYALQGNSPKRRQAVDAGAGVLIVTGRSRRLAVESHTAEIKELMLADGMGSNGEVVESSALKEVKKTVGEVGSAFVGKGVGVGVWVLQAALNRER